MLRFIIIEPKSNENIDEVVLMSLFSEFISITHTFKDESRISIYFDAFEEQPFEDVILNIISDTLTDLRMYVSILYEHEKDREDAHHQAVQFLKKIPFSTYFYLDNKVLIKHFICQTTDELKAFILRKYAQDKLMKETIKVYLESNQHMIQAAKQLFIHRNTLIQRLDKFYQTTGLDPKNFMDAYLIYGLIQ